MIDCDIIKVIYIQNKSLVFKSFENLAKYFTKLFTLGSACREKAGRPPGGYNRGELI